MPYLQRYPYPNICGHLIYFLKMQAQFKLTDGMKIRGHYVNEFVIKIEIIWQFCVAPIQIPTVFSTNICIWHDSLPVMACVNICRYLKTNNWIKAIQIFHRIWIWMEKFLVKSALEPLGRHPSTEAVSVSEPNLGKQDDGWTAIIEITLISNSMHPPWVMTYVTGLKFYLGMIQRFRHAFQFMSHNFYNRMIIHLLI